MRMPIVVLIVLCLVPLVPADAETEDQAFTVTPMVGLVAVTLTGAELIHSCGPSGQIELGYKFENGLRLGAKGGGVGLVSRPRFSILEG